MLAVNPRATWSWPQRDSQAQKRQSPPVNQTLEANCPSNKILKLDPQETKQKQWDRQSNLRKGRNMRPRLKTSQPANGPFTWNCITSSSAGENKEPLASGCQHRLMPILLQDKKDEMEAKKAAKDRHFKLPKLFRLKNLSEEKDVCNGKAGGDFVEGQGQGPFKRRSAWYSSLTRFAKRKKTVDANDEKIEETTVNPIPKVTLYPTVEDEDDEMLSQMAEKSLRLEPQDVPMEGEEETIIKKRNKCFQSPRIGSDISQDSGLGDETTGSGDINHNNTNSSVASIPSHRSMDTNGTKSPCPATLNPPKSFSFESPLATSTIKKQNFRFASSEAQPVFSARKTSTSSENRVTPQKIRAKVHRNAKTYGRHHQSLQRSTKSDRKDRSSVAGQWDNLCHQAEKQVLNKLAEQRDVFSDAVTKNATCDRMRADKRVIRLVFNHNVHHTHHLVTRQRYMETMSATEVGILMDTVYRILFLDWIGDPFDSIIVHCVQKFLIVVVDACCSELDIDERLRLAKEFKNILTSSESSGYKDLGVILKNTQVLYIQLWCALLCVPFHQPKTKIATSRPKRSSPGTQLNLPHIKEC